MSTESLISILGTPAWDVAASPRRHRHAPEAVMERARGQARLSAAAAGPLGAHAASRVALACRLLGAADAEELRRVVTASAVAEVAYKRGEEAAWGQRYKDALPSGACDYYSVRASPPGAPQRFVVAEGEAALYVGIMGTKALEDVLVDVDGLSMMPLLDNDRLVAVLRALPADARRALPRALQARRRHPSPGAICATLGLCQLMTVRHSARSLSLPATAHPSAPTPRPRRATPPTPRTAAPPPAPSPRPTMASRRGRWPCLPRTSSVRRWPRTRTSSLPGTAWAAPSRRWQPCACCRRCLLTSSAASIAWGSPCPLWETTPWRRSAAPAGGRAASPTTCCRRIPFRTCCNTRRSRCVPSHAHEGEGPRFEDRW